MEIDATNNLNAIDSFEKGIYIAPLALAGESFARFYNFMHEDRARRAREKIHDFLWIAEQVDSELKNPKFNELGQAGVVDFTVTARNVSDHNLAPLEAAISRLKQRQDVFSPSGKQFKALSAEYSDLRYYLRTYFESELNYSSKIDASAGLSNDTSVRPLPKSVSGIGSNFFDPVSVRLYARLLEPTDFLTLAKKQSLREPGAEIIDIRDWKGLRTVSRADRFNPSVTDLQPVDFKSYRDNVLVKTNKMANSNSESVNLLAIRELDSFGFNKLSAKAEKVLAVSESVSSKRLGLPTLVLISTGVLGSFIFDSISKLRT